MLNDAVGQRGSRTGGIKGTREQEVLQTGMGTTRGNEPSKEQEMGYRVFGTLAELFSSPTWLQWGDGGNSHWYCL